MKTIKNTLLIFGFVALSFSTIAQTQVITFAPMGLVNKFRMKYENVLNGNFTSGLYFNAYYAYFKGIRFDPFIRLYPADKAPKGFYIQAKAVVGYFNSNLVYDYQDMVDTLSFKQKKNFSTYGGGIGIGYQFLVGKGQMPIDLFLGFQYSKFTAPQTSVYNGKTYTTSDDVIWYFTGPGSFLNCNFGIGFSF
ncbi:MAG: hypothetical protein GW876_03570 [Bacteroidetes bacterium]|nr:hypothetical protein [Bacteroidota bacterium]PIX32791.1 MAG: hypothetical protein COZ59_12130 [Bacteroidetes bacterium CG_4_8_14_3_um_filter_31_14]